MPNSDDDDGVFQTLRRKLGITSLIRLINELSEDVRKMNDRLIRVQKSIWQSKETVMTEIQQIFDTQAQSAVLILSALSTIRAESLEFQAAIEAAVAGRATPEELQQALANAQSFNTSLEEIQASVAAIVPGIVTPTPAEPLPATPDVVTAPEDVTDVVIEPTPDEVGLEGVSAIDFT